MQLLRKQGIEIIILNDSFILMTSHARNSRQSEEGFPDTGEHLAGTQLKESTYRKSMQTSNQDEFLGHLGGHGQRYTSGHT